MHKKFGNLMRITTLSAQLDQKLNEIDQRLTDLQIQIAQSQKEEERHQLRRDVSALTQVREKLLKSRDIAWRAHRLQQENEDLKRVRRKGQIGLVLCALSVIGAIIIAIIFWWTEIR